jgi:hypothetical protein
MENMQKDTEERISPAADQQNSIVGENYRSTDLIPTKILRKWLIIFPVIIVILGCLREWLLLAYGVQGTSILSLNREQNVGAWYSTLLIFSCAFLLMVAGRRASQERNPDARYWYILAIVFVALSFDEASSVHEMLMDVLQPALQTSGPLLYAWVVPALVLVPVFGFLYIPFLRRLRSPYGLWFFGSGAVFVAGALGMEMIGGMFEDNDVAFTLSFLVEESLELAGMTSFFLAVMGYLTTDTTDQLSGTEETL